LKCTFEAGHEGACSFAVLAARRAANRALLVSAGFDVRESRSYTCEMCVEDRSALRRDKAETVVSPAGETLAVTSVEVGEYKGTLRHATVCLRCSSVAFEAAVSDSRTTESVAAFLTRMARVDRPLGVDEAERAIELMQADIQRLAKLLPPEPYR